MTVKLVWKQARGQIKGMARRKNPHLSLSMRDDVAEDIRVCEWPGCTMAGGHPAPRSRNMLRDYRWFCLEHIRLYNSRWNYFDGMTDDEVEADLRYDTVWNRPSWPLSDSEEKGKRGPKPGHGPFGFDPKYFADDFGLFDEPEGRGGADDVPRTDQPTRAALAVFGLALPITAEMLKTRYKELVKKHHPDTNGGTKAAEEKFKEIRDAYEKLRLFLVI